jgi:hypothetical protein
MNADGKAPSFSTEKLRAPCFSILEIRTGRAALVPAHENPTLLFALLVVSDQLGGADDVTLDRFLERG